MKSTVHLKIHRQNVGSSFASLHTGEPLDGVHDGDDGGDDDVDGDGDCGGDSDKLLRPWDVAE